MFALWANSSALRIRLFDTQQSMAQTNTNLGGEGSNGALWEDRKIAKDQSLSPL
jgi:hypothetical protein